MKRSQAQRVTKMVHLGGAVARSAEGQSHLTAADRAALSKQIRHIPPSYEDVCTAVALEVLADQLVARDVRDPEAFAAFLRGLAVERWAL